MSRLGSVVGSSGALRRVGSTATGDIGEEGRPDARVPRLVAAVLLVLSLLLLPLAFPDGSLHSVELVGTRGPVCEHVVLLVDQSGSMADLAGPRDVALRELLAWLPDNLRLDDLLSVVDFASTAAVRMPPTPVGDLGPGPVPPPRLVAQLEYTYLAPALAEVATLPATSCDLDVLLLSDGQFIDLPPTADAGRNQLLAHDVHDLHLLVPAIGTADPPAAWDEAFPDVEPVHFDGHDTEESALAMAGVLASCTGQKLVRATA